MKILFFLLFTFTTTISFGQKADTSAYPIDNRCDKCLKEATTTTYETMNCFAVARESWALELEYYDLLLLK